MGKRLTLMLTSFAFFFLLLELGYRRIDPYPYFSPWEMNRNEHGNLTEYDARLGWKGSANAETVFVTQNARVTIAHNATGHRDIREDERSPDTPAIVFLGDSFTWGYDVEFKEAFANRVRKHRGDFEIYNYGHRGYGTDQSLLAFESWPGLRPLGLVFLMFYENDVADNSHDVRSLKPKPRFRVENDELVLTHVPVPHNKHIWEKGERTHSSARPSRMEHMRNVLFKSHLMHALHRRFNHKEGERDYDTVGPDALPPDAWDVTSRLIKRINDLTHQYGGQLCLVRIPSKGETLRPEAYTAYDTHLRAISKACAIDYIDLRPHLQASPLRTYYRDGIHWTPRGHEIVAQVLLDYLAESHPPSPH